MAASKLPIANPPFVAPLAGLVSIYTLTLSGFTTKRRWEEDFPVSKLPMAKPPLVAPFPVNCGTKILTESGYTAKTV